MLTFSLATDRELQSLVQQYIFDVYGKQGYVSPDETHNSGIRSIIGRAGTYTVVALVGNDIVGTISLVHGANARLPMETLYETEVQSFIDDRATCAEIGQFAIDDRVQVVADYTKLDVTIGLLAHVIAVAEHQGVRHCFFTINPKHRPFYESIGCVQIGGEKEYGLVHGAPALAYVLDLQALRTVSKKNFIITKIQAMEIAPVFIEQIGD